MSKCAHVRGTQLSLCRNRPVYWSKRDLARDAAHWSLYKPALSCAHSRCDSNNSHYPGNVMMYCSALLRTEMYGSVHRAALWTCITLTVASAQQIFALPCCNTLGLCWQHHYQRQIWTCGSKSWCGEQANSIPTQGLSQMGTASPDHPHLYWQMMTYTHSANLIQMLHTELC